MEKIGFLIIPQRRCAINHIPLAFLAKIQYDTGVEPKYGDQFITLSTCSYHVENGRFAVVARRIEDAATNTTETEANN